MASHGALHGGCRPTAVGEDDRGRPSRSRREGSETQVDRPGDLGNCEGCLAGVDGLVTTNPGWPDTSQAPVRSSITCMFPS